MKSTCLNAVSIVLLSVLLATLFTGVACSEAFDGGQVEIIRDNWGVPHIFADTSEDAFFGLGYATAEDRMFQMEYSRRIVQGRISEIIGESGLESDKLWRTIGWYRNAQEAAENMDLETRRLLEAYSAGVNYYLEEKHDQILYLFEDCGIDPEPWKVADSIACWYRLSLRFSNIDRNELSNLHNFEELIEQLGWEEAIAQMFETPTVDESGAIVRQEDMDPELIAEIAEYAEIHGYNMNETVYSTLEGALIKASHAWIVGGARSTTGSAILHSDPQIIIYAPSLWYEFHIFGGDFDARGIGVAGAPGMLIGWNRDIAWGATAAGGDLNDLFKLEINPSNPNQYYYDGAIRDIEIVEEEITVKNGRSATVTCRGTVWGPIVTSLLPDAYPGEEVAMKHVEVHNLSICSLMAMMKIMRANDWVTFQDAIENYMSPAIHLIYGDKSGNIGYQFLAGLPLRSAEWPHFGRICHLGNSSQYDWQEVIPKTYIPHVFNPSIGVISTANNMAAGSWYPLPISFGTGDTIRSWRLRERLAMVPEFTQEDVLDIHRDTVNPAVREIVRLANHIAHVQEQVMSEEAINALEVLDSWNGEYNTSQPAYPLIENFNLMFRPKVTPLASTYGGGQAGLCYFAKTVKINLDQDPYYVSTSEEIYYVDSFLKDAWQKTVAKYGNDPSQWLLQYERTISLEYQNNLENFGSIDPSKNIRSPELDCTHTNTILSQHGNSYSQNVRFDNIDLSKSILPPGLSEHPNSPHFGNQIPTWSSGELHQSPLNREAIEELATKTLIIPELHACIILSPENKTYSAKDVPLNFTVKEPTSWIGYSLDRKANTTISGNIILTSLTDGSHYVVVYINDTAGNIGASNVVWFTVDTTPPTIAGITQNPSIADDSEAVTITVTVTDHHSGVNTIILSYKINGGSWINIVMTNTNADIYEATIPGLPAQTNVEYQIVAYDVAGHQVAENNAGLYYVYTVIPEFPTWTQLFLILIVLSVALAIYKHRLKHFYTNNQD